VEKGRTDEVSDLSTFPFRVLAPLRGEERKGRGEEGGKEFIINREKRTPNIRACSEPKKGNGTRGRTKGRWRKKKRKKEGKKTPSLPDKKVHGDCGSKLLPTKEGVEMSHATSNSTSLGMKNGFAEGEREEKRGKEMEKKRK